MFLSTLSRKIGKKVLALSASFLLIFQTTIGGLSWPIVARATNDNLCTNDIDVVLLMDSSGSMGDGYPTKLSKAKQAARSFVDKLGQNDQSALVSFSVSATLEKGLSNNHTATKDALNSLTANFTTNIGDAIALGNSELGSQRANPQAAKAMILLTDGLANQPMTVVNPTDYAKSKADIAAAAGYKIFTIGFAQNTSDIDENMLKYIANKTGADYYYAPNGDALQAIYDEISYRICQTASISGCKYHDVDRDGNIAGEEKLAGWTMVLGGDATAEQQTDENGCYTFSGLEPGNYTVKESCCQGKTYTQTYPSFTTYQITLGEGQHAADKDFGNYYPICGNAFLDTGEVCEIGDTQACGQNGNQSCLSDCSGWGECVITETCGNDIIEGNEECDGQTGVAEHYLCTTKCTLEYVPYCGDSLVNQESETCDNDAPVECTTEAGYAGSHSCAADCSWASCQSTEVCGDGLVNGPEICDDGAKNGTFGFCNSDCSGNTTSICGNGVQEGEEACDDGNTNNGDGCSADCAKENNILPGQLIINELMWMGNALDAHDEWLEIYNPGSQELSLSGCRLVDQNDQDLAPGLGDFSVSANNYLVVSFYTQEESHLDTAVQKILKDQALADDQQTVKLVCGQVVVDQAGNGAAPLAGENLEVKKSMQRKVVPGDGSLAENWCTASSQINWDQGVSELGTPGDANNCDVVPPASRGSIAGHKYGDSDGDVSTAEDRSGLSGWLIKLFNLTLSQDPIATATTDEQGYYYFNQLLPGTYTLAEELKDNWTQLLAPQPVDILAGLVVTGQDFVNYYHGSDNNPVCGNNIKETGEECDGIDGVPQEPGYSCTAQCATSYSGGGGGGGGGGGHLIPPVTEPVGGGDVDETIVLGESGAPNLTIVKTVKAAFANPGDVIDFQIVVSNNGNLTAFNTWLHDVLPAGFSYLTTGSDGSTTEQNWTLGDLLPDASQTIDYRVTVGPDVVPGVYVSPATVQADNNAAVSAEVSVEVREVQVLAATGFSRQELWYLLAALLLFGTASFWLRSYLTNLQPAESEAEAEATLAETETGEQ